MPSQVTPVSTSLNLSNDNLVTMELSISKLSFEHHRHALGISEATPRISWRFEGDVVDWEQSAYDLEIVRGLDSIPTVHTINSSDSLFVPWPEDALTSTERASVRARAHGQSGQPSTPWSDWVSVETGLLDDDSWAGAVPITADREFNTSLPKQPLYFRKPFSIESEDIQTARLYITALGMYEAEINGQRVGDYVLAPGFQSYHNRHAYDTYDITELIQSGDNAIGVTVGEGWWAGRFYSFADGERNFYGDTIGFFAVLMVTFKDGMTITVPTDDSWQASTGPILDSQIYDGEKYDSRLEADLQGWSTSSYESNEWLSVRELPPLRGQLVSPDGPPVRRIEEVEPQTIFQSPSGKTLVDFGQNLVGWLRLTVSGPAGTNITLQHVEVLENGEISTRPLRNADATDILILHGNGLQTWEPKFTYHGFRYVQVDGWPEDETPLTKDSITAVVIHSDMEQTGFFECSDPLLNKLHQNVRWSMKGNFVSIPTDCPQRDERAGWTGDAHTFMPTSNYLYDAAGLWRGWHKDIWLEMQRNGTMIVPVFVPALPPAERPGSIFPGIPAALWGDVAVGGPWNLWLAYGDALMLEEQYAGARGWIDKGVKRREDGLWNRQTYQYGDWLDPKSPPDDPGEATTAKHLVADAYLIRMTELLANISSSLGQNCQAVKYQAQREELRRAFYEAWVQNGTMANRTQTAYALGLHFNIFDNAHRGSAADTLRDLIAENDYHVGTGFAGTHILGHALRDINSVEYFYSMLLQTEVPSWLYQVVQNATTTWERWDSILPSGEVNPGSMTSFNHYSFGSVADWMHKVIGGLAPATAGWKTISVAPVPGGGITNAEATFISGYGKIKSRWWFEEDGKPGFHLNVWVPPNSRAIVQMPNEGEIIKVGSGFHEFYGQGYLNP